MPTLSSVIRDQAVQRGASPAITYRGATLSYADLDMRSSQVAQALRSAGVRAGDRVAQFDKNSPAHFEVLFGTAKIGAWHVPVNWRLSPEEIVAVLVDSGAEILVVGSGFAEQVARMRPRLPRLRLVVGLGEGPADERYEAWLGAQPSDNPGHDGPGSDVAMLCYTSGTTGLPKAAMVTHDNLSAMLPQVAEACGFSEESVNLVAMPLFHVAGGGWTLVGLISGSHTVLLREVDPADILASIGTHGVTHALFVPAVLQLLVQFPLAANADLASLELIFYGASPISRAVLSAAVELFGCAFIQGYGLTETTGAVVVLPPAEHRLDSERLEAAGQPLPGVELRVADPETGIALAPGAVGEVCVRGDQVSKGYWQRPEETARAMTADGWFRTGDAGRIDEDGFLSILDRVKDMVVTGGENVYPAEVENVLMAHPAVADAAAIGVPNERYGEAVKAIIVPAPGMTPSAAELIAFTRERLAHYKCPTSVEWATALPRNASGKILKAELREPYWAGRNRRVN